eukprot:TRINITY_DN171_c0_g1_i1.p1 TRINITY_DN171_c0_g1~~TRINITY_DN171_c0_g1_i1.p1  ORF type:complete len:285 (+),score=64.58 TRINITY_DN171_c0_g1_i1:56-910(+)
MVLSPPSPSLPSSLTHTLTLSLVLYLTLCVLCERVDAGAYEDCVYEGTCVPQDEIHHIGASYLPSPLHVWLLNNVAMRMVIPELKEALTVEEPSSDDFNKLVDQLEEFHGAVHFRNDAMNEALYVKADELMDGEFDGADYLNDENFDLFHKVYTNLLKVKVNPDGEKMDYTQARTAFLKWIKGFALLLDNDEENVFPVIRQGITYTQSTMVLRYLIFKRKDLMKENIKFVLPRLDPIIQGYYVLAIRSAIPRDKTWKKTWFPLIKATVPADNWKYVLGVINHNQ